MAYFNQEMKKARTPAINKLCKEYGVKATYGVNNHSTFVINISSGALNFIEDLSCNQSKERVKQYGNMQVNPYWFKEHFTGKSKEFLEKLFVIANKGNHDNSDIQSDYFDVGFYVDVNIGKWNKPYTFTG